MVVTVHQGGVIHQIGKVDIFLVGQGVVLVHGHHKTEDHDLLELQLLFSQQLFVVPFQLDGQSDDAHVIPLGRDTLDDLFVVGLVEGDLDGMIFSDRVQRPGEGFGQVTAPR